jgi:CRISPR-associated protein Csd2
MTTPIYHDPNRRHDALFLLKCTMGNPNGDPDMANRPRQFPNGHGFITDVAIKRRVRDWMLLAYGAENGYEIYVQRRDMVALNNLHAQAYDAIGMVSTGSKQHPADISRARDWMSAKYWDIRMFGAVMTTGKNCGQVKGPLQITGARSVAPVEIQEVTITRVAITKEEDLAKKTTEMGQKFLVPEALYVGHLSFVPHLAHQTGVSTQDLARFWEAFQKCWEIDRSASRGDLSLRGLHIFSHEHPLGNAPAHKLFECIALEQDGATPDALPAGITYTSLV